jgi:hypothetical protein
MIFVLIAVLQTLQLTVVTEPFRSLLTRIFDFLPRVLGAGVLLIVAWIAANILRRIVTRALDLAKLDERIQTEAQPKAVPLAKSIGEAVYWLVFLMFLPAVLGAMELDGLLRPVQNMFDDVLGFLPNILAAVMIGLIGWFVAGIVRRIVTNLLAAAGSDRLGERMGLATTQRHTISNAIGLIVEVLSCGALGRAGPAPGCGLGRRGRSRGWGTRRLRLPRRWWGARRPRRRLPGQVSRTGWSIPRQRPPPRRRPAPRVRSPRVPQQRLHRGGPAVLGVARLLLQLAARVLHPLTGLRSARIDRLLVLLSQRACVLSVRGGVSGGLDSRPCPLSGPSLGDDATAPGAYPLPRRRSAPL